MASGEILAQIPVRSVLQVMRVLVEPHSKLHVALDNIHLDMRLLVLPVPLAITVQILLLSTSVPMVHTVVLTLRIILHALLTIDVHETLKFNAQLVLILQQELLLVCLVQQVMSVQQLAQAEVPVLLVNGVHQELQLAVIVIQVHSVETQLSPQCDAKKAQK